MQNLKKIDIDPAQAPLFEKVVNYGIYEVIQIGSIYIHNTVSKKTYEFIVFNEDIDISPENIAEWLKDIRNVDPDF